MRRGEENLWNIDWITVLLYVILLGFGWLSIYASVYDETLNSGIFDPSLNSGRQFIFILISIVPIIIILILDFRIFDTFAIVFYGVSILLLIITLFVAREINGARSWIELGSLRLQPSEFVKISTAIMLAKVVSTTGFKFHRFFDLAKALGVVLIPFALIVLQNDRGTAIVYASLIIVLYREGMTPAPLILGFFAVLLMSLTLTVEKLYLLITLFSLFLIALLIIKKKPQNILIAVVILGAVTGFIYSVDFIMNDVLEPHQKKRIEVVFNPNSDPLGAGWNVTQSKIAIGSGGLEGKGYLKGTQTKFDFVPEQSTDFIFCTIGEEHGFLGSFLFVVFFVTFLLRLVFISERQKWRFARVYGYSVVCIFFVHFAVNIGMTIGLFPVIGIPLPFFSYGGSSLFSFTIMLFLLLKFDSHRKQVLLH